MVDSDIVMVGVATTDAVAVSASESVANVTVVDAETVAVSDIVSVGISARVAVNDIEVESVVEAV